MQKIKDEKGVTMIMLAIMVVVMLILISVVLNYGINSIDSSDDMKLKAELEMIQHECLTQYTKASELGYLSNTNVVPNNFFGTHVDVTELPTLTTGLSWVFSSEPAEKYKYYFRLTPEDLDFMGIYNSDSTYIVNYYTGEVYNETLGVSSQGVSLYVRAVTTHQEKQTDNTSYVNW